MAFGQRTDVSISSWGVAPGYGGKRPSAKHGRRPEAQFRGLRFEACSPPRMNAPAGTSLGSLGRATSLSADPLSHFRNRKKKLARPAASAVESQPSGTATVAVRQLHEPYVAIERRLRPAVWLIDLSPPIEHGRSTNQSNRFTGSLAMTDSIVFSNGLEIWDANRTSLLFLAARGKQSIRCVLPFLTIMDSYSDDRDYNQHDQKTTAEKIYAHHRDQIHDTCRQMIEDGLVRDGELVIKSL